jgi:hypothetical protein
VDFFVEGGDGLAVIGDPIAKGEVLRLHLASPVFSLVDALAEVLIFLAEGLVDLDVVTHVEDVELLHDDLLLVLIPVDLLLDF